MLGGLGGVVWVGAVEEVAIAPNQRHVGGTAHQPEQALGREGFQGDVADQDHLFAVAVVGQGRAERAAQQVQVGFQQPLQDRFPIRHRQWPEAAVDKDVSLTHARGVLQGKVHILDRQVRLLVER